MISRADLAAGLGTIALQLRQPITEAEIGAYHLALEGATDAAEFRRFVGVAVLRCGWRFMPSVVELHDALQEFRGGLPLIREAALAYERVLESGTYTPQGGTTWDYRTVLAACGRAAADAFLDAGGPSAFRTSWDEGRRRAAFVASYIAGAREAPADRLLPAPGETARPELPPARPELSDGEARSALSKIARFGRRGGTS